MRKILLLLIICLSTQLTAQLQKDSITGSYYFEKIYKIDTTKAYLNLKAKEFFAKTFKDSKQAIRLETENKLIAKGNFRINLEVNGYPFSPITEFSLELALKEGKYKLNISDIDIVTTIDNQKTVTPIADYFDKRMSFEDYKDTFRKSADTVSDNYMKKYFLKLLKDEAKLRKDHNKAMKVTDDTVNEVVKGIENISEALFIYIKNASKEEDW